jgi:hypothetical protein
LLRNCLLKHVIEGKIQEKTEVTRIDIDIDIFVNSNWVDTRWR